jgi:hypothetical protein
MCAPCAGKCGNSDTGSANVRSRDGSSLHILDRLFLSTCMNLFRLSEELNIHSQSHA